MKNINFKQFYPYVIAVILFITISHIYFPEIFNGKTINQSDISSWKGAAHEIVEYREKTGEEPLWTNSMFSGMPTNTISTLYPGNFLDNFLHVFSFTGKAPASYFVIAMLGFYLLLLAFGVNAWLAIVGAISFAFCAYNFQILQVGHNAKMAAIGWMPWVLAGLVYAFRKKPLTGAIFFGIALAFEIMANHPQITFYLAIIILFYGCAQLYMAIKSKTLPKFFKTAAFVLVATLLASGTNVNHLWPTWEYSKYTMRGGSELKMANDGGSQTKGGLDKEYATAWSYGIGETANILIPNFKGGASYSALGKNSEIYKTLKQGGAPNADQIIKQMPTYWGEQAFTAGPMYMGAISVFFFVLGLVLIKGPMKWWIAGVSLLALLLGWGRNFMWLSHIFYDYVPLYNKFRVPSMILIVLQLTIPLLGIYTLNKIFKECFDRKTVVKGLKLALGITGGFCLLFVLIPGIAGSFVSPGDAGYEEWLRQGLPIDRQGLLRADAIRSLIYILLAGGVVWLGYIKKIKFNFAILILGILVLADMWTIDKRYLNDAHFVTAKEFNNNFTARPVDRAILQDQDPNYRVLDLSVNTFNDSYSSYHHKTIGGYSAAKLQRYQDMIEYHISPEMQAFVKDMQTKGSLETAEASLANQNVLNMLNTKYLIIDPNNAPLENRSALGNAWYVQDYKLVNTPDEEILSLKNINPAQTAVIGQDFASHVKDKSFNFDENASIKLTSYAPNKLEYKTTAANEQLAVFSEIYYPKGWKVTIDGQPAELFRTDYILRGLIVPAGEHNIVFEFKPESYYQGAMISSICSGLLLLFLLGIIVNSGRLYLKKRTGE